MLIEELLKDVGFETREANNPEATPANAVVPALPDNENADSVFGVANWKKVSVEKLLNSPTSVRFLSPQGLLYFLPAIEICVLWGLRNHRKADAILVYDHAESTLQWHSLTKNSTQNFDKLLPLVNETKRDL